MIVLDTNVISEPWKIRPDPNVLSWIDRQLIETLYLTTITLAEMRYGLQAMPTGKRRDVLLDRLEGEIIPAFSGRILPFDLEASRAYGDLMARARAAGLAIGKADGYIAATAAARNLMIATRDTSPFEAAGLRVINPWAAAT
jgi:predicted nucleic acid-binding protein